MEAETMTEPPVEISVIIPSYNSERTIAACLESLRELAPETPPFEVIVADNGSTDGSVDIIRQFSEVKLVFETERRGAAPARNAAVPLARGKILAFTDSDCVAAPLWLLEGIKPFEDPTVVGVAGGILGVSPSNFIQEWMNARRILDQEHAFRHPFMPFIQTANAFYRRKEFMEVGMFDTTFTTAGEDCDLSWRLLLKTGGRLELRHTALIYHDHRCTVTNLFKQSRRNAACTGALAEKWGQSFPPKHWKASVWELLDITKFLGRYIGSWLTFTSREQRQFLGLDLLHRIGRKWGLIQSAWASRRWTHW